MLKQRAYETFENYNIVYEDENIISYKLKDGMISSKDCELCNDPHSYLLVIKNKAYGYNIRIPLCEMEYSSILESIKKLNEDIKN